jgi:hypothetical protein
MKIPEKLQVFDTRVTLLDWDARRLKPWLSSAPRIVAILQDINEPDLMRLVVLELMDRKRYDVIHRLLARLGRVQRNRIEKRVVKLL